MVCTRDDFRSGVEAGALAERALGIASAAGREEEVRLLEPRLDLNRSGKPLREEAGLRGPR